MDNWRTFAIRQRDGGADAHRAVKRQPNTYADRVSPPRAAGRLADYQVRFHFAIGGAISLAVQVR